MAFHCTSCNGSMVFDAASQQMKCLHCGSTCDPQDFAVRDQGIDGGDVAEGMARFTCQNCGAALTGTDDSLVGFCPYCGGQSMVREAGGGASPERLIPFQVDKEKCVEAYRDFTKKVPYLPAELSDPEHLQRFTGIYMPFWQYDVEFGPAKVTGMERIISGNTETLKEYEIDIAPEAGYHGLTFDASRYLDDELAARVLPFDAEQERPYSPAYLAGFYADASSVSEGLYHGDVAALAAEDLLKGTAKQLKDSQGIVLDDDPSVISSTVTGSHSLLYPLWFLTWRREDRVAYAVVNGESGKVVSDLPLSLGTFAKFCGVTALALFALLELLVQPTPLITALISMVAALVMANGIKRAAQQEWQHQTHANDKGWKDEDGQGAGDARKPRKGRKKMRLMGSTIGFLIVIVVTVLFTFSSVATDYQGPGVAELLRPLLPVVALAFVLYVGVKILTWHSRARNWMALSAYLTLLVSALVNAAVLFWNPVNDGWFYLADAACIAGLIAASVLMIRAYNVSTMRPVPKLFDREEVQ